MAFQTHYINTDLEIVSVHDLNLLADALETLGVSPLQEAIQLDDGTWMSGLETDEQFSNPEPNILVLLAALDSLEGSARELWETCTSRVFDIGYSCGDEPFSTVDQISAPTLARVAAHKASVRLTLYAADRGEASVK